MILPTVTTGSLPNESVFHPSIEAWNADDHYFLDRDAALAAEGAEQ